MTRAQLESDRFIRLQDFLEEEFMQEVEAKVARYVKAVVPGSPVGRVLREANGQAKGEAVKSMSSRDREDDFFAPLKRHLRMDMKARARVKPETAVLPGKEARL